MIKDHEIVAFLKKIDIFSSLTEEEQEQIAAELMPEKIPAGYPVTEKALPAICLYIVASGVIEVVERNEEGAESVVGEFKEGEYFGEISLLTGEAWQEDTRTKTDTELLVLYKKSFDEMLQKHASLNRHFVSVLSNKLRLAGGEIERAKSKEILFNRFIREEFEFRHSRFVAHCKKMKELERRIAEEAGTRKPLLIVGENGAGKELVARSIHQQSRERQKPFMVVNSSLIEKQNWGEEIFGCEETGRWRVGFLELADEGVLLLTKIENLPSAVQCELAEFMRTGKFRKPGSEREIAVAVRIIASSELGVEQLKRQFLHPELGELFQDRVIEVPPLRQRKRDLPVLIEHLREKISHKSHMTVERVSAGAMELLLNYEYPNNVDELENILERAAILAEGGEILREHIIFGIPRDGQRYHFNLLHIAKVLQFLRGRSYPRAFQVLTGVWFTLLILACFWGAGSILADVGRFSVWSLWWPLLLIFTFLAARWWCGICPVAHLSAGGEKISRAHGKASEFLGRYDFYLMAAGMLLIFWAEEIFHLRTSTVGTGVLLSSIGGAALLSGLFFGGYAWCRHLCPLGGILGIFSKTAVLEVRSNRNICTNQCKTHACYRGNGYAGCPMQLHPLELATNQKCKMCFNCLKNCPHRSIRLDLRPMGEELWAQRQEERGAAVFSLALAGVLLPLIINRHGEVERLASENLGYGRWGYAMFFWGALIAGALVSYGLFSVVRQLSGMKGGENPRGGSWVNYAFGFLPLALAGHIAYQLSHLPLAEKLTLQLGLRAEDGATPELLSSIHVFELALFLLIAGGMATSGYVFWRIYRAGRTERGGRGFLRESGVYVLLALIFSGAYVLLFSL